jgi:hypothetical protein
MRTIGWLRRVAPELDEQLQLQKIHGSRVSIETLGSGNSYGSGDGALGALLLVCRLASLEIMLEALEPLRDLADQETSQRIEDKKERLEPGNRSKRRGTNSGSGEPRVGGQQTERYLKRYIEIFREQSFAIVSMYKSIFPSALPVPGSTDEFQSAASIAKKEHESARDALLPLPSPLATFSMHLVESLFNILQIYLPNVRDKAARESLMTQVLYCAGSLGRLGGDFSMMLALLEEDLHAGDGDVDGSQDEGSDTPAREEEWVQVMKKHRIQASRLELLASGVGSGKSNREPAPVQA